MKRYGFCLLLFGCQKTTPLCQEWTKKPANTPLIIEIKRPGHPHVVLQAVFPASPRTLLGAPTAIFIHGGWNPTQAPLAEDAIRLRGDLGFTTLYPNLAATDARGPESRAILAKVLQYANGEIQDEENCYLDDRLPNGRAPEIALAGFSNGGNLAWATASDPDLNIQRLDGIATFETPSAHQMVVGETGTQRQLNPRFDVDSCAVETSGDFTCEIDYTPLGVGATINCVSTDDCLFIDLDGSNDWSAEDFPLGHVLDPQGDAIAYSIPVTMAAEEAGILPDDAYGVNDAMDFWRWREATASVPDAAKQFPMLAGIATGTEIDHVLDDLPRPIHVLGLIQVMVENGIHWSRLHADSKYLDETSGFSGDWRDYPANSSISIDDNEWTMEPEDGVHIRGTDYLSAAVAEIIDRSRTGDWSPNL